MLWVAILTVYIFYSSGGADYKDYRNSSPVTMSKSEGYDFSVVYSGYPSSYKNYIGKVNYYYSFLGKEYIGQQIGIGTPQWPHRQDAENYLSKLGKNQIVYVSNSEPTFAYLIPPAEIKNTRTISIAVVILLFTPFFILGAYHDNRDELVVTFHWRLSVLKLFALASDCYFVALIGLTILLSYYNLNPLALWVDIFEKEINVSLLFGVLLIAYCLYRLAFFERTVGQIMFGLSFVNSSNYKVPKRNNVLKFIVINLLTFGVVYISTFLMSYKSPTLCARLVNIDIVEVGKVSPASAQARVKQDKLGKNYSVTFLWGLLFAIVLGAVVGILFLLLNATNF